MNLKKPIFSLILLLFSLHSFSVYAQAQNAEDKELTKSEKDSMAMSPNYLPVQYAYHSPIHFTHLQFQPIDTSVLNVPHYDPSFLPENLYQTLGLNGQAHKNMIFEHDPNPSYFLFTTPYPLYYKTQDQIKIYDLSTTYTDIEYTFGIPEEHCFNLAFAQKIGEVNASVNLFANNNAGAFLHQNTRFISGDALVRYEIPSSKYGFRLSYIINSTNNHENGGLVNIDDFAARDAQNNQGYEVNTPYGYSKMNSHDVLLQQYVNLQNKKGQTASSFTHNFQYQQFKNFYHSYNDSIFSSDLEPLFLTDSLSDSIRYIMVSNTLQWSNFKPYQLLPNEKKYFIYLAGGITHDFYRDANLDRNQNSFTIFGRTSIRLFSIFDIYADISYAFHDYLHHDAVAHIRGEWAFNRKKEHFLGVNANFYKKSPEYFYSHFQSQLFTWDTTYRKQNILHLGAFWRYGKYKIAINYYYLNKHIVIDEALDIKQLSTNAHITQASIYLPFRWRGLGITANINLQHSTNDSISVPLLSGKLDAYYIFKIFRKKLQIQVGANVMYNTPYYGYAYAPEIRSFHLQNNYLTGNYCYFGAYATLRINRIYFFFRGGNLLAPLQKSTAITTPNYPLKDFNLAFGIRWRFHD